MPAISSVTSAITTVLPANTIAVPVVPTDFAIASSVPMPSARCTR